jgi:hypothetical protein
MALVLMQCPSGPWDWRGTLWKLLLTFCIVIISCTETFWSPCITNSFSRNKSDYHVSGSRCYSPSFFLQSFCCFFCLWWLFEICFRWCFPQMWRRNVNCVGFLGTTRGKGLAYEWWMIDFVTSELLAGIRLSPSSTRQAKFTVDVTYFALALLQCFW